MPTYNYETISKSRRATLLLDLSKIRLSTRLSRILCDHLEYKYVYEILPAIKSEFMDVDGFGESSWEEIAQLLKTLGLRNNVRPLNFNKAIKRIRPNKYSKRKSKIIREKLQSTVAGDPEDIKTLHDELLYNISLVTSEENYNILSYRWGWNGGGYKTLKNIGAHTNMNGRNQTIEKQRVRQIVSAAESKIPKIERQTKITSHLLSFIKSKLPTTISNLHKDLENHDYVDGFFHINGLLKAFELLLGDTSIKVDNYYRCLYEEDKYFDVKEVVQAISKKSRTQGICNLDKLREFDELKLVEQKFVKAIISQTQNFRWLDKNKIWVTNQNGQNNLENILQKIFSVAETLSITDVKTQVSKERRLKFQIPLKVFKRYLRGVGFLTVSGENINCVFNPSYPFQKSDKFILEHIPIKESEYNFAQLQRKWVSQGRGKTTFETTLYKSPIVKNLGNKKFILIGKPQAQTAIGGTHVADGKHKRRSFSEAVDDCVIRMVNSVGKTVKSSGKMGKKRRSKTKKRDMDDKELALRLKQLMKKQDYKCNLTGLKLDVFGDFSHNEFMPSPDRIDSAGHYSKNNLQVVCWFINRWKKTDNNDLFIQLLESVRTGKLNS